MMPGHSGYEVCRATRAISADVPTIFISAKAEEFDILVGFETGADDFIVKPFSLREDEVIELSPRDVRILQLLHENSGRAMDRSVIFRHG